MADVFIPGDEIWGYLDYLPFLAQELKDGGRPDLASRVWETDSRDANVTRSEILEIFDAALKLGSHIALEMATRWRVDLLAREVGRSVAVSDFPDRVLEIVGTHWATAHAKRLQDAVGERENADHFIKLVLDLEKECPRIFEITGRLGELDDLMEYDFQQLFMRLEEDLASESWTSLETRVNDLHDEHYEYFDTRILQRIEDEFRARHGPDAVELAVARDDLKQEWEEAICPATRDYLMSVYSGLIRLGPRRDAVDEAVKPEPQSNDAVQPDKTPRLDGVIDEDSIVEILDTIVRQGGDQKLLDAVELAIRRSNARTAARE